MLEHGRARELLQEALRQDPAQYAAHVNLGNLEEEVGNREEAERHFKEAVHLGESDPATHYSYAHTCNVM